MANYFNFEDVTVQGKGQIIKGDRFIFPADTPLTGEDISNFVQANNSLSLKYYRYYKYYLGHQDILDGTRKKLKPDNRVVANLVKYVVETFNGFFIGVPPKINLDNKSQNDALQDWMNFNSFQDQLSEASKQCDIYGRSYIFLYQDENSETKIAISDPINSFIIYDDSVAHKPLAFIRYNVDEDGNFTGSVYDKEQIQSFDNDFNLLQPEANLFHEVPAVEFIENDDRQSLVSVIISLQDSLNKALSQKANQVEYFDNAYLKIMGVELQTDQDTGEPILNLDDNQIIYAPSSDSVNGKIEFLQKPDGDNIQEHLIDHYLSMIFQTSMVANLTDQEFSGNASGVAIDYKLLPMKNMAVGKERKFTQSLRGLFKVIFSMNTVFPDGQEVWKDLNFKFTQNTPINMADEADVASKLTGVVSQQTQLGALSIVDDPKTEMSRMQQEEADRVKNALKNSPSALDMNNASERQPGNQNDQTGNNQPDIGSQNG